MATRKTNYIGEIIVLGIVVLLLTLQFSRANEQYFSERATISVPLKTYTEAGNPIDIIAYEFRITDAAGNEKTIELTDNITVKFGQLLELFGGVPAEGNYLVDARITGANGVKSKWTEKTPLTYKKEENPPPTPSLVIYEGSDKKIFVLNMGGAVIDVEEGE